MGSKQHIMIANGKQMIQILQERLKKGSGFSNSAKPSQQAPSLGMHQYMPENFGRLTPLLACVGEHTISTNVWNLKMQNIRLHLPASVA